MGADENIGGGKKIFKIAIRFADEEAGGLSRDRMLAFAVEAGTLEEAKKKFAPLAWEMPGTIKRRIRRKVNLGGFFLS